MTKISSLLSVSLFTLASLFGCGDDEEDKGGGSKPTAAELARGEGCPGEGEAAAPPADCDTSSYSMCVETQCASGYQDCLGAGYKNGDFTGGRCAEYMQCVMDSSDPCNAPSCTPSDDCSACFIEIGNCVLGSSCEPPSCAGGAPAGEPAPGSSGGGCVALTTCCSTLTGEDQTNCNSTLDAAMGLDVVCDATLGVYQASGSCP